MHNIIQAASARLQNSVEAVDGREALLEQMQHEEAARRRGKVVVKRSNSRSSMTSLLQSHVEKEDGEVEQQ